MILGKQISLIPATLKDKRNVYDWLCHSDTTPSHMGPPNFPDHPVPTWNEFCDDYSDFYFDGSALDKGRCFLIMYNGVAVGVISYSCFHLKENKAELDIWMNCSENCGKGYGSDAINTLCKYLFKSLAITGFIIRPSARNKRAVRAYEKAGFKRIENIKKEITLKQFILEKYFSHYGSGDYGDGDDIVLIKEYKN